MTPPVHRARDKSSVWLFATIAAGTLAGCGAHGSGSSFLPTLTPATSTPTPASVQTPAPPPPLVVIHGTAIDAVDVKGHVQWRVDQSKLATLLPGATIDNVGVRTAGQRVFLTHVAQSSVGQLVVLDRTGATVGTASFVPNVFKADDLFGNPTGTQWAFSVDDTPDRPASQSHRGRIVVAGLGVPEHTVFSWVAPPDAYTEVVAGWTDMGIVMERTGFGGCGIGYHPDQASFLVDPGAGTITSLFKNGDHYADASHGVRVALAFTPASAVLINGATYDEAESIAQSADVSPDGVRVGIQRYSMGGCAGTTPTLSTEIVDVSAGSHIDVPGCGIDGWFDSAHFVCNAWGNPNLKIEGVDGSIGAVLEAGEYGGTLTSR
jgi:hypothetical protein